MWEEEAIFLFQANAVNEVDSERDRAKLSREGERWGGGTENKQCDSK